MVKVVIYKVDDDGQWGYKQYIYSKKSEEKWIEIGGDFLVGDADWLHLLRLIAEFRKVKIVVE